MNANGSAVYVGDRIRFSVELIREYAAAPDFSSILVQLREVRQGPGGTKILVLDVIRDERQS